MKEGVERIVFEASKERQGIRCIRGYMSFSKKVGLFSPKLASHTGME